MVAIFVVMTILTLVAVDYVLQRRRQTQPAEAPASLLPPLLEPNVPSGVFVHPGHTWAEILASGLVRIGLDDFVRYTLGRPDRLLLRNSGERVRRGDPLMTVERDGRQLVLVAPLSGTIERSNQALAQHPESLTRTAYGENWTYTIKPDHLGDEIGHLKVAEKAKQWLSAEMLRLADWFGGLLPAQAGLAMQDGGMPAYGALGQVEEKDWRDFQDKFLAPETT